MMHPRTAKLDNLERILGELRAIGWSVMTDQEITQVIPTQWHLSPDFIAIRGDEKIIGEVVSRHRPKSAELQQLERLSESLAGEWQVKVYYVDDAPPAPNEEIVHEISQEARAAAEISPQAAVLLAWSGIEMALDRLEHRYSIPRSSTKIPSISQLNSIGAISDQVYDTLLRYQRVRNEVAHARTRHQVPRADVIEIAELADILAAPDYRSPDEMAKWFKERYTPSIEHGIADSESPKNSLSGPESIYSSLRNIFPNTVEADAREVANLLANESPTWVTESKHNNRPSS
jgi:hypothetical protein